MPAPQPHTHASTISVVGGGIAGSEAAWQLAQRGMRVRLFEMRPGVASPAHHTSDLAELVCSNSLKSDDPATAAGLLKRELREMDSLILECADATRVPAGGALAVDRTLFSALVTERVEAHPRIEIVREEVTDLPSAPAIICTGPLTSDVLAQALAHAIGRERLAFFDAAAPIIDAETIDRSVVFAQSRYGKGGGADYLNAPLDRTEYEIFIEALLSADRVHLRDFESRDLFQACQPIEEVARSGADAPRYGALKPVGLLDPRTGTRPWAVVQLRAENVARTAYNLVGFQTNLTFPDQERVFRLIPGLEEARFLRHGVMHRNTFVDAPRLLGPTLELRERPGVWLAGQLTGTEGYVEAAASGLIAALNCFAASAGLADAVLPPTSALGALLAYATDPLTQPYQPMHVNFGIVPALSSRPRGKRERYAAYSARAVSDFDAWRAGRHDLFPAKGAANG